MTAGTPASSSPKAVVEEWIESAPRRDLQRMLRDITAVSMEAFILAYQLHDVPPQPKNTTPKACPTCKAKAGAPCTYLSANIHRVGAGGQYAGNVFGEPMQMIHHNRPRA